MSLLLALTVVTEIVTDAVSQVGGAKDRPKKRPRQSAYFTQHPAEPAAPMVRSDDDEILLLMTLGAL